MEIHKNLLYELDIITLNCSHNKLMLEDSLRLTDLTLNLNLQIHHNSNFCHYAVE